MTQLQNQPHTQLSTQPIYATQYRIYLEDTDAGGIVYHANHSVSYTHLTLPTIYSV